MKSVFIVVMAALNDFTRITWGFSSREEAEKFRELLDTGSIGASRPPNYIEEYYIFDSIKETGIKFKETK